MDLCARSDPDLHQQSGDCPVRGNLSESAQSLHRISGDRFPWNRSISERGEGEDLPGVCDPAQDRIRDSGDADPEWAVWDSGNCVRGVCGGTDAGMYQYRDLESDDEGVAAEIINFNCINLRGGVYCN